MAGSRRTGWAMLALLAAGLGGCSYNPATGQRQFAVLSREDEIAMGSEAAPQFRQEMGGPIPDQQLQAYVTDLTKRLAAHTEGDNPSLPWEVSFLNSGDINAFAIPGGKVFITRGLVEKMTNEAQLAGVMGHEVGHVTARHTAQQVSKAAILTGAVAVAGVVVSQSGDERVRGVGQVGVPALAVGGNLVMLSFGRSDELEADRLGVRYMTKLDYDPKGLRQVMELFQRMSAGGGQPSFLSTHPDPGARIQQIDGLLGGEYAFTQNNPKYQLQEERFRQNVLARLNALPPAPKAQPQQRTGMIEDGLGPAVGWCGVCAASRYEELTGRAVPVWGAVAALRGLEGSRTDAGPAHRWASNMSRPHTHE